MMRRPLLFGLMILVVLSGSGLCYAQGSFVIANKTNETQVHFLVNGSTHVVSIGTNSPGQVGTLLLLKSDNSQGTKIQLNNTDNGGWTIQTTGSGFSAGSGRFSINEVGPGARLTIENSTGNVGIGTVTPQYLLQVGNVSGGKNVNLSDVMYIQGANVGIGTTAPAYLLQVVNASNAVNLSGILYINGSSGNVGIGTAGPKGALQMGRSAVVQSIVNDQTLFGSNVYYTGGQSGNGAWKYIGANYATAIRMNTASGDISFHLAGSGSADGDLVNWDVSDVKMRITNSGNVGIGTASPQYLLQVANVSGGKNVNLSDVLYIHGANVGIGTKDPLAPLHLVASNEGTPGAGSAVQFIIENIGNVSGNNQAEILLNPGMNGSNYTLSANDNTDLFRIIENNTVRFAILGDKIGIGTATPVNALDVAGNINATGNITANGHNILCPQNNVTSNWTSIEAAGRQLGCIQTHEHKAGTRTWLSAADECFTTYGGRLPTIGEWYVALNNHALLQETDDYEWVADYGYDAGYPGDGFVAMGSGGLTTIRVSATQGGPNYAFRCWIPS